MKNNSQLYRVIWRWHFYAGLFCIPFILTLAVSGSIYLFKPQIDQFTERAHSNLVLSGARATPQQHINTALKAFPGSQFINYRLPQTPNEAVLVTLKNQDKTLLAYLNPNTLEIVRHLAEDEQFIHQVRNFHGELLMGNTGSILVELASNWAIVMLISGLYLWWPRSGAGLAGVVYPRIKRRGRLFWRDLHAVTGFWVAFFTLFLLISGLPWTTVWGGAFKELRSLGKPPITQDWTTKKVSAAHEHHQSIVVPTLWALNDNIVKQAQALNFAAPVTIAPAKNSPDQWQVSSNHQNRTLRAEAWLDASTEQIIKTRAFADKGAVDKIVGVGISVHEGQLFGWANQLLGLFTAISLITLSITGFILWLKRKPTGTLGAPVYVTTTVSKTIWAFTFVLASLLPLLAISLLALIILEYCLLRRIPALRNWLGLQAG